MQRILVTGEVLTERARDGLRAGGLTIEMAPGDLAESELISRLRGMWGYIVGGAEFVSQRIVAACPDLRAVCFVGTGYQSYIDPAAMGSGGPAWTYTPHANVHAVAELTVGLMLALRRRIPALASLAKSGGWTQESGPSLIGATVGIVGMGHIGREVARICRAGLGMDVVYWNRTVRDADDAVGTRVGSPKAVVEAADIVSLHCGYSPATHHLIGEAELAGARATTIVVNTARAALVDPMALRTALAAGRIAGAAFDGYYLEPVPAPADDPHGLMGLPDATFLLTPHVGFATFEAGEAMGQMVVENLLAVKDGRPAPYLIPVAAR